MRGREAPVDCWTLFAALVAVAVAGQASSAGARHAPARVVDTGTPRVALAPRDAKLDSQLRRLLVPAIAPASRLVPVAGAWQQGDAVRVQVELVPGAIGTDLRSHGLTVEREREG